MSIDVIPSGVKASSIALITAAGAPVVPPSPAPFTPKELVGLGTSFKVISRGVNHWPFLYVWGN